MQNSKAKMDEIKYKFLDWKNQLMDNKKRPMIPAMGFSDYFIQNVTTDSKSNDGSEAGREQKDGQNIVQKTQKSDQEILESIEDIYFQIGAEPATYELEKVCSQHEFETMDETILKLRKQLKVLSKQMLQNILEKRSACNAEFGAIGDVQKNLEESLWTCRKARSYLNYARTNLTTTSLEILASYRKREILQDLLGTLEAIKKLKSTDVEVQNLLSDGNYSGAISLLLKCKDCAAEYMEYHCVQSLNKKLLEHEFQTQYLMDTVLNEMILNFDARTYAKLMEAYKLLNKSQIAMDQLHINFVSTIHSTVNGVLLSYNDPDNNDDNAKLPYEQMCEQVKAEQVIACLVSLCKTTWTILAAYYQIVVWHQNYKLYPLDLAESPDIDIQEKLKKGQTRIWNDIMLKICIFLQSTKLTSLKYDQFIQALSIVQRLKKVGAEFCGAQSEKLIEIMQTKSEQFFQRYHIACLEEICLFLDNESWTVVDSISNILNLPEFRAVRHIKQQRHKTPPVATVVITASSLNNSPSNNCDEVASEHSQEGGSSIYGSYGYFLRFSEKSSPFDGGLDSAMLEEDILSGIVDEASCYFSEESDDEQKSLPQKYDDETTNTKPLMINNTTLNIFRCIGRYLQMCKLLHSISPKIVKSMFELLDFYAYAIYEIFGKDAPVQSGKFNTNKLQQKLKEVEHSILINIKIWPLNFSSLINNELANPDMLYGLSQRVVAVESCHDMLQQFGTLQSYLLHLLPPNDRTMLMTYLRDTNHINDIRCLVYTCVTSRVVDIPAILMMMSKVKWDQQVSFQHSSYIDIINRNIQNFSMFLEDIGKSIELNEVPELPLSYIWSSIAHVVTHLLVEGFSNVKKCSAGGRALMQLDFTNLMSFLELMSNQKFPDYRSYADNFIKAYYFSTEQFSDWIETQMQLDQYSTKQLINLVHCLCVSDKRVKQKLLNLLENGVANLNLSTNSNVESQQHVMYSL